MNPLLRHVFLVFSGCLIFSDAVSQNADIELLRKINVNRNPKLDNTFRFITNTKSIVTGACFVGMAGYALLENDSSVKYNAIAFGESLIISTIIAVTLKYGVNRPRPYKAYPDIQKLTSGGSPSFPSGHTSEAFSTATSLSISYPKWYVIAPAALWASAVGYSRMDLGVHYPSDVLAGAVIGSGSAFLGYWLTKKLQNKKKYVAANYRN
jgi:membrane-associated phospholipid phosphatase